MLKQMIESGEYQIVYRDNGHLLEKAIYLPKGYADKY